MSSSRRDRPRDRPTLHSGAHADAAATAVPFAGTLHAVLDHIAIAVPDRDPAERRWRDELGGRVTSWAENKRFHSRQLRFNGGGKLELLAPPPNADEHNFVRRFLARFGSQLHHVTLKVPDLREALAVVEAAGYATVDARLENPHWQEFFLRPGEVGGLVVQIAWSPHTDEQWARMIGHTPEPVPDDAAVFSGARINHPDRQAARRLWWTLGADVVETERGMRCAWPHSPLQLWVDEAAPAGPVSLYMEGRGELPAAEGIGPEVESVAGTLR